MFSPVVLAVAILAQGGSTARSEPKPYKSAQGKYTVQLPSRPTEKRHMLAVAGKTVNLVTETSRKGLLTYSVGHADVSGADTDAALKAAQADVVGLSRGEVKEESDLSLGDGPGRALTIEVPKKVAAGGAVQKARIYVVNGKLYELIASAPMSKVDVLENESPAFFDSFRPDGVNLAEDDGESKPSSKVSAATRATGPKVASTRAMPKSSSGSGVGNPLAGLASLNPFGKPAASQDAPKDEAGGGALGTDWKEFTPPDKTFTAKLPGNPQELKLNVPTPAGNVELKIYAVEDAAKKVAYLVQVSKLPAQNDTPEQVEARLDGAKAGILAQPTLKGAKIAEEKKIKYQGFPGRELLVEVPANPPQVPMDLKVRTRIISAKGSLFQMQAIQGGPTPIPPEQVQAYFNSLKIPD